VLGGIAEGASVTGGELDLREFRIFCGRIEMKSAKKENNQFGKYFGTNY